MRNVKKFMHNSCFGKKIQHKINFSAQKNNFINISNSPVSILYN